MSLDPYPTDEELEAIERYEGDWNVLLETIVKPLWWPDGSYGYSTEPTEEADEIRYRLSTWGWSGNESIIASLKQNKHFFWSFCWESSRRGGHHTFVVGKQNTQAGVA